MSKLHKLVEHGSSSNICDKKYFNFGVAKCDNSFPNPLKIS